MSSVFLNKADLLAERLNRVAGLESYRFVVSRPKKIDVELEKLLAKFSGGGVIVWKGGTNEQEDSTARIASQYRLVLAENPTLRRSQGVEQDGIVQLVIAAAHGWEPDTGPNAHRTRFKLQSVTPDEVEARVELIFTSITQLPNTEIFLNP